MFSRETSESGLRFMRSISSSITCPERDMNESFEAYISVVMLIHSNLGSTCSRYAVSSSFSFLLVLAIMFLENDVLLGIH